MSRIGTSRIGAMTSVAAIALALGLSGGAALAQSTTATKTMVESRTGGSVSIETFREKLRPEGEYVQVRDLGDGWKPRGVDDQWKPYTNGRWIFNQKVGWYFESQEPWAEITYHYGRWYEDPDQGWVWVADTEWAPAWVEWRRSKQYVGWRPLPPKNAPHRVSTTITTTRTHRRGAATETEEWVFVPTERITSERITTVMVDEPRVTRIYEETRPIGRVEQRGGVAVNFAIDPQVIERESSVRITSQNLPKAEAVPVPQQVQSISTEARTTPPQGGAATNSTATGTAETNVQGQSKPSTSATTQPQGGANTNAAQTTGDRNKANATAAQPGATGETQAKQSGAAGDQSGATQSAQDEQNKAKATRQGTTAQQSSNEDEALKKKKQARSGDKTGSPETKNSASRSTQEQQDKAAAKPSQENGKAAAGEQESNKASTADTQNRPGENRNQQARSPRSTEQGSSSEQSNGEDALKRKGQAAGEQRKGGEQGSAAQGRNVKPGGNGGEEESTGTTSQRPRAGEERRSGASAHGDGGGASGKAGGQGGAKKLVPGQGGASDAE